MADLLGDENVNEVTDGVDNVDLGCGGKADVLSGLLDTVDDVDSYDPFADEALDVDDAIGNESALGEAQVSATLNVLGASPSNTTGNRALDDIPDTGEIAEVVLVTTSLGSIRRQFYSSKRMAHFLDCKGVVYYIVDSNRDVSSAKNLKDVELFNSWKEQSFLKTEDDVEWGRVDVVIPQILIDGVQVGGEQRLQDLEEDGDLEWMLSRAACPSCLHEKDTSLTSCPSCNMMFRNIVPPEMVESGGIQQIYCGQIYNSAEDDGPHFEYPILKSGNSNSDCTRSASGYCVGKSQNYEDLFGEDPPDTDLPMDG